MALLQFNLSDAIFIEAASLIKFLPFELALPYLESHMSVYNSKDMQDHILLLIQDLGIMA